AISKLSSRAQISSSKAIFVYNYGDLPGNEKQLLVKYFDAMFYIANWGSLQLMFRFPKGLIDIEMMRQYCVEDIVEVSEINDFVILEISINEEEGFFILFDRFASGNFAGRLSFTLFSLAERDYLS
ncbi:MAG: hypothetical protein EAZ28_03970, partial [Oscillatoriales cyanobacterium]